MKKIISLTIMAVACLAFAGCGSGSSVEFDTNRKTNLEEIYVEEHKASNYLNCFNTSINTATTTIIGSEVLNDETTVILILRNNDVSDTTPVSLANEIGETILADCVTAEFVGVNHFRVVKLDGEVTKIGLYDASKKAFLLEPSEIDFIYYSNIDTVSREGKYYNLMNDGALINSSSVGEDVFDIEKIMDFDEIAKYKDGYITQYYDSYNNVFFRYYDRNFILVDEFKIFTDPFTSYYFLVNGDILAQTVREVTENDDYTFYSSDSYAKITNKIYSAKTGNARDFYFPYYLSFISNGFEEEIRNPEKFNYVYAMPIVDRQLKDSFYLLFNDNLSSLLHVYFASPYIVKVKDGLYVEGDYFVDENENILGENSYSYSDFDYMYADFISNEGKTGIKDYKGKIVVKPIYDTISNQSKNYFLVEKTVDEVSCLFSVNAETGVETLISNNYTNFLSYSRYYRYVDAASDTTLFKSFDNKTLLTVTNDSTTETRYFEDNIYITVTKGTEVKTYLFK